MASKIKPLLSFIFAVILLLIAAFPTGAAPANRIENPVIPGWNADPDVEVFNGKYYIYPTNSTSSYNTQYHAYSSDDMVNWKDEGVVFDFANITWCNTQAWAPDVIEKNGTYYLYFSACDGKIGVATSSSPAGPFVDAIGGPLLSDPRVAPCYADIDPAAFIDTDGQAYLYFGTENLCVRKLNPNMKSFEDTGPTQLTFNQPGYKEGSEMIKRNGVYYLSWSTGGWGDCTYNVHYGRSNSPYGPFTDEGVIVTTNGNQTPLGCGPGHHSLFKIGTDEWYIGYHKHPVGYVQDTHRYLAIDKLNFNADGTIQPVTMTSGTLEGKLTSGQYSLTGWWKFDETSGALAADSSAAAHPAAISGPTSWTTGKVDGAFNFTGSTYASVSTAVYTADSYSVSAWVKLNNLNGIQTFVSQDGQHVSGFFLQYGQSFGNKFAFSLIGADDASAPVSRAYSTSTAVAGEWVHLTGVYDKPLNQIRLYVNGKLEGVQTLGGSWASTGSTVIGAGKFNDLRTDFANAAIDDVRTFAYPLSDGIAKREYLNSPNLNLYWNFNEASGNANDESGSAQLNFGDYGIPNGGATRTAGKIGNGMNFDGANSFVSSSSTNMDKGYSLVDSATDYSVSAWVKLNNLSGWQTMVSVDGHNVSGFFLQFGADVGNKFAFSVPNSDSTSSATTRAVSTTAPQADTWYHLVGVHDRKNGQLRLYVNGNLEATAAMPAGWIAGGNVIVGAGKWGGRADYFNGIIDEVRLYNKVLSNAEILSLAGIPAPAPSPLSWPEDQVLPSFAAPAANLDVMDIRTEYVYQAEGPQIGHDTGHLDGDGWLAQTGIDTPHAYMVNGPHATDIPIGENTAFYDISIDDFTYNNAVMVTVDVRDDTTGTILASRDITRNEWDRTYAYQRFELPYNNAVAGHSLAFRVFWHGGAYNKVGAVGTVSMTKQDEALLFTTLKGLVNKTSPRIASYDNAVHGAEGKYGWLDALGIGHTDVTDNWTLITKYRTEISGIVIYDGTVKDTINLATTIASLKGGIVASPAQVSKLISAPYNLPIISDLRGQFTSKTQVYQYLYNNYWPQVTHRLLIGLNPNLKGFLRDYATAVGTAVVWLDPSVPAEDAILRQFLSGMPSGNGIYMGWWPDEAVGVSRVSEYGISTVASDFASNLTVFGGTSRTVNVKPMPNKPPLENKIYVSLILSDGDNLQYLEHKFTSFWNAPNRGQVPLGWTVSPAMLDAMPGVLNYLYNTATPNDAFISGPSGIGYTYPNNWGNQNDLDNFVALSNDYLDRAGLKVVTVWNTINGGINTNVGNSFANNAPSLLGLTGQNAGGSISLYNNLLPAQGLNATYCYSTASIISEINAAVANWNGTSPKFVSIQTNPWQDADYQSFVDAVNNFSGNSNIVFVRPDTYFQLMRENMNLPTDPSSILATYEAENTSYASSPFNHNVGRAFDNGWTANVTDDNAGFMLWGPYVTSIPAGQLTTTFQIKIDSLTGNNDNVITLDVRDNTTGQLLAVLDVYRNQFEAANAYQNFSLTYPNTAGHALEFRAYYKDNATINIDKVTTTTRLGQYEAEGSVVGHIVGHASGDGWQASSALDSAGHMLYGPYDPNVPIGNRKVAYRLKVDNNTLDNDVVATIDVWDATAGIVLAQSDIARQQFLSANQYQYFDLTFNQTTLNHRLEFRIHFKDNSILTADKIIVN